MVANGFCKQKTENQSQWYQAFSSSSSFSSSYSSSASSSSFTTTIFSSGLWRPFHWSNRSEDVDFNTFFNIYILYIVYALYIGFIFVQVWNAVWARNLKKRTNENIVKHGKFWFQFIIFKNWLCDSVFTGVHVITLLLLSLSFSFARTLVFNLWGVCVCVVKNRQRLLLKIKQEGKIGSGRQEGKSKMSLTMNTLCLRIFH